MWTIWILLLAATASGSLAGADTPPKRKNLDDLEVKQFVWFTRFNFMRSK